MNKNKNGHFFEQYAWVIFFIIGVAMLGGGIPHAIGFNTDSDLVKTISGETIEQLQDSNPLFFDLYDFYFRGGGLSDVGVAFFIIIISIFAFRTYQKWAWYSFWFVPIFFGTWILLILPLSQEAKSSMLTPLITFTTLSIVGLVLPIRKFFPKNL